MKMLLKVMLAVCLSAFAARIEAGEDSGAKTKWYHQPGYPQFRVVPCSGDPRVIGLHRTGASLERPCELSVFEAVGHGQRLRRTAAIQLKNSGEPLGTDLMGHGRFYVTVDDWRGVGNTDNCVVIYDLHLQKSASFKLEDFLPAEVRSTLRGHAFLPGVKWRGGIQTLDDVNLLYYPTRPEEARKDKLPFVVVDLRSVTVESRPVPDWLPATAVEYGSYLQGLRWDCSFGADEPDWNMKSAQPTLLRLDEVPDKLTPETKALLDFKPPATFELEASTGDYVRCDNSKWVPRSSTQAKETPVNDNREPQGSGKEKSRHSGQRATTNAN